jgi:hypothetical protein
MVQMPPIPIGPVAIGELVPIVALIVLLAGMRWMFRSPIGDAVAERIRMRARSAGARWGAPGAPGAPGDDSGRVAALEEQVTRLEAQVAELAERLDFAERLLAGRRADRAGGAGGAGGGS